jgi:hypothetical protein
MNYENIDDIRDLILRKAVRHRLDEVEDWEAEIIELECSQAIFEYIFATGLIIEDVDLRKLLDAVDDEDEGVPEAGVDATFEDITQRICNPEHDNPIAAPAAVKQLFAFYYETFWPGQGSY